MYVCFSPSPSLSHSLSLSAAAVARVLVDSVFTMHVCSKARKKHAKPRPLSVSPVLGYFLPCQSHWMLVVSQQFTHVPASVTQKSGGKLAVFLFLFGLLQRLSLACSQNIVCLTTFH